ncbi:hypothetical protein MUP07_00620, partial [Candidatus Bathyarchaeota archaeon]|nr:hypothetical protein [Candidatus Bathyarchaeota archaeon]
MPKSIVAALIGWVYMLVGAFNIVAAFVPELQVYSFQAAQYVGFGLMSFLNISILFIGALMIPIG